MDASLLLLLGLVVGLLLGGALGWLARSLRTEAVVEAPEPVGEHPDVVQARHEQRLAEVRTEAAAELARMESSLSAAKAQVESRLAAAEAQAAELRERVASAQQQYRDVLEQHRREAAERESAARAESKVLQQLAPVTQQLKVMREKVDQIEQQRSEQHGHLAAQIRASQESAERSRQAAETLSSALRNNTVRGAYGEMQLQSLVESAGLINRVDYSTQQSITADSGARRPDMVVRLPGRKQLAIDAKTPYNAYVESCETTDDDRRATLLSQHARAVRAHVDALASKEYWTGLETSPEFTIAFIPNDAILGAALDADPTLMEHAFAKGIVLATPVNLWAVLKTVAFTWKQEDIAEHAAELVDLGRTLYKRLATLSDHVAKLGRSIERTVGDYNKFVGSLERQVLVTARKLDAVDEASLVGTVNAIEDADTRSLTAAELVRGEDDVTEAEIVEEPPAEQSAAAAGRAVEQEAFVDLERPELDFDLAEPATDQRRDTA